MREILFKAKTKANKDKRWVCGFVWENGCGNAFIRRTVDLRGRIVVEDLEIDSETVCEYTGKKILQNQVTAQEATEPVMVWQDDLIAIYTVYYDDDDKPVRKKIAVVCVEFDKTYKIMYAQCVYGTMQDVANECEIEYMDGSEDWPFTFWLEYMENSSSQWWEWEVIGNIHDNEVSGILESNEETE